jgi:choline monooxygenase
MESIPDWSDLGATRGHVLPGEWYRSPEVYALEVSRIFARSWQYVAPLDKLRRPGDYITCTVANEPILVVRDRAHRLRAFSNVCRHRACIVASGYGNRPVFSCPYHGWSYRLDGSLANAPEMDDAEGFDPRTVGLHEFLVDVWGPLVFVHVGQGPKPVGGEFDGLSDLVGPYELGGLQYAGGRAWTLQCNWKTYVDNFMEGYHVAFVHPGLRQAFADDVYDWTMGDRWNAQYGQEPNPRGPGTRLAGVLGSVAAFRRIAPPMPHLRRERERKGYYFIWMWPNLGLNLMPDGFALLTMNPAGTETTIGTLEWWFPPTGDLQARLAQGAVVAFGHQVNQEDVEICERVQQGLRSALYIPGRYCPSTEHCLHHFHRLVANALDLSC